MNNQANINQYKNLEVSSSNRLKVIVMVYDALIASLKEAVETHGRNDLVKRNQYISRAQFILLELNNALDINRGGDIATTLRSLYHFTNRSIGEVVTDNNINKVRDALTILKSLHEAWKSIEQETKSDSNSAAYYHRSQAMDAAGNTAV